KALSLAWVPTSALLLIWTAIEEVMVLVAISPDYSAAFCPKCIPLCLGLLSVAVAYATMTSLVTIYIPRYVGPMDPFALFAILVAIISIYETRGEPRP